MRRSCCANGRSRFLETLDVPSTGLEAISPATPSHAPGRADLYLVHGDRGHAVSWDHWSDDRLASPPCARLAVGHCGHGDEWNRVALRQAMSAAICHIVDAWGTRS